MSSVLQASPLQSSVSPTSSLVQSKGMEAKARLTQDHAAMYCFVKDASSGRVLVPDVVDLFNKVTYEVLANTVLGSEWMSIMTSFGKHSPLLYLTRPHALARCRISIIAFTSITHIYCVIFAKIVPFRYQRREQCCSCHRLGYDSLLYIHLFINLCVCVYVCNRTDVCVWWFGVCLQPTSCHHSRKCCGTLYPLRRKH